MKSSRKIIPASETQAYGYPVFQLDDLAYPVAEEPAAAPHWPQTAAPTAPARPEPARAPHHAPAAGGVRRSIARWVPEDLTADLLMQSNANTAAMIAHLARSQAEALERQAEEHAEQILDEASRAAEAILQKAQQEAEALVFQAQAQVEAAIQQARQDGRQAGEIAIRSEMEGLLRTTEAILVETQDWRSRLIAQSEPLVVDLVKEMARAMFGEGVALNPEALQHNFYRITEAARNLGELKIFVHPEDAEKLDPMWLKMRASMTGSAIQIIPSNNVLRGGCFVQGQMGTIDGRVETQLKTMLTSLDEAGAPPEDEAQP